MNDKYMQEDILELVKRIEGSIANIDKTLAEILDWQKNRQEMEFEFARLKALRESPAGMLAGQQPRRDGDGFPILSLEGSQPNAHREARDIRPPGVGGD